jgi:hypothetical protein
VFLNTSDKTMQVKYIFPLEANVGVCKFEASIGDKTIKGVIKEKEDAKATYDVSTIFILSLIHTLHLGQAAVKEGKKAALLDKDEGDVFS